MIILWLMSCGEPELEVPVPQPMPVVEETALEAYDRAMAFREAENWTEAVEALSLAVMQDPESPSLRLWLAQSQVDEGSVERALATLSEAIERFPMDADCRYNRAALRAREGNIDGAVADLRYLAELQLLDPGETGSDPDFAALREDERFADVVRPPRITVDVRGEAGGVLIGEVWELRLDLHLPLRGSTELHWVEGPPSLLHLDSVVEQEVHVDGMGRVVTLSIRWRAMRSGRESIGPWRIEHDGALADIDAIEVEILDLGTWNGRSAVDSAPQVPLPSSVLVESSPEEGIARHGWRVVTDTPTQAAESTPNVHLEWRQVDGEHLDGHARWLSPAVNSSDEPGSSSR